VVIEHYGYKYFGFVLSDEQSAESFSDDFYNFYSVEFYCGSLWNEFSLYARIGNEYSYWIVLGVMFIIAFIMLVVFKIRRWF